MSSKPSSLGAPRRRTVVPIRPAVPLIYEPQPRGGSKTSDEGKPISKSSSSKESHQEAEPEEERTSIKDAQQQPSESPRSEPDNGQSLESQKVAGDVSSELRNVTVHESREMEMDRLQVALFMAGDAEVGSHRLILGEELEKSGLSISPEEHLSEATLSPNLPARARNSSGETQNNSSASASNVRAINFVPPVTHPAPHIQFGSYNNGMPAQQVYANPYLPQQHDPQGQYRFSQSWHGVPHFNQFGGQPPPTPSSASLDDGNAPFDPKLAGQISSNFNVERYADVRLIVTHERERFKETVIYLHRIIVSRSETIRRLLDEFAGNCDVNDGKLVVRLRLSDRFITPTALLLALQTCYGQQASCLPPLTSRGQGLYDDDESVADMHEILALAATGHLLNLEDVAVRAVEKVEESLTWSNVEHALSFGLESCAHRHESSEALLLKNFSYSTPEGDILSVDCAPSILDISLSFMDFFFPDFWIFDQTAARLPIVDRLPFTGEPPRRNIKSRLARLHFGQFPRREDPKTVDRDQLISSIVLSVPLISLCRIGKYGCPSLMRELPHIIEERERRRLAALNSDVHWNQRRLGKDTEWLAVGFRERYSPVDPIYGELGLYHEPVSIYRTAADEEEARKRDQARLGRVEDPQGVTEV